MSPASADKSILNQIDLHEIFYDTKHNLNLNKLIPKPKLSLRTEYDRRYLKNHRKNSSFVCDSTKNGYNNIGTPQSLRIRTETPVFDFLEKTKTQYSSEYKNLKPSREGPSNPKNCFEIEQQCPFSQTTTYGTSYIGHRGPNQYVKVNPQSPLQLGRFKGQSVYDVSYRHSKKQKNIYESLETPLNRSRRSCSEIDTKIAERTFGSTYKRDFYKRNVSTPKPQISRTVKSEITDYSSKPLYLMEAKSFPKKKSSYSQSFNQIKKNNKNDTETKNVHLSRRQQLEKYRYSQMQELIKRIVVNIKNPQGQLRQQEKVKQIQGKNAKALKK